MCKLEDMEDLYLYFDEMIMGPDGQDLYDDIMRLQREFYEISIKSQSDL